MLGAWRMRSEKGRRITICLVVGPLICVILCAVQIIVAKQIAIPGDAVEGAVVAVIRRERIHGVVDAVSVCAAIIGVIGPLVPKIEHGV